MEAENRISAGKKSEEVSRVYEILKERFEESRRKWKENEERTNQVIATEGKR